MQKPKAKKIAGDFYDNLPHFEGTGNPLFITFCTAGRWVLPTELRYVVLETILEENGVKFFLLCAVVMPDHVHLLYLPTSDGQRRRYTKGEVLGATKSVSAHKINKYLERTGQVWQPESFDHVLRRHENVFEKIEYVCQNPVRAGICERVEDYPWLWVDSSPAPEGGGSTIV